MKHALETICRKMARRTKANNRFLYRAVDGLLIYSGSLTESLQFWVTVSVQESKRWFGGVLYVSEFL